jgi:hypothetical protein
MRGTDHKRLSRPCRPVGRRPIQHRVPRWRRAARRRRAITLEAAQKPLDGRSCPPRPQRRRWQRLRRRLPVEAPAVAKTRGAAQADAARLEVRLRVSRRLHRCNRLSPIRRGRLRGRRRGRRLHPRPARTAALAAAESRRRSRRCRGRADLPQRHVDEPPLRRAPPSGRSRGRSHSSLLPKALARRRGVATGYSRASGQRWRRRVSTLKPARYRREGGPACTSTGTTPHRAQGRRADRGRLGPLKGRVRHRSGPRK